MENFVYQNPVKIIFGKDTISKVSKAIPANARVLLTYGGGSIKKTGVYDQVKETLKGVEFLENQMACVLNLLPDLLLNV